MHTGSIRLAELMAALSTATDLGMGQPMDFAMTTCIVAVRLGEALGFDDDMLRDAYYEALLRYIGCNADTYWLASIVGDELALRSQVATIDTADNQALVGLMLRFIRQANTGIGVLHNLQALAGGMVQLSQINVSFFPGHCEVARRLAQRLEFNDSFVQCVGQIYARWDGAGVPGLKGDAISPAMLCVTLAQDAVLFCRNGGVDAAVAMARKRSGGAYAPQMVEMFCARAAEIFRGLDQEPTWDAVLRLEPGAQPLLDTAHFDAACDVIADYTDIKSPYLLNHSRGVAELAERAATVYGLPKDDAVLLRRAGMLHDIGRVGVSAAIWGKAGPLSQSDWEKVRLHPYYTGRIFARSEMLTRIAALAVLHHERLDGSGYHRGLGANALNPAARLLAAADVYQALTEPRPHRPAFSDEAAAEQLQQAARGGTLDDDAVRAVLSAAGHAFVPTGTQKRWAAGLSEREAEVLRLLARGNTMKQIAAQLTISYKTVDRHAQNIYTKIGVNTRAGATLFAMEHGLVDPRAQ